MLLLIPVSVTIGSWERIACREECFGEASRPQSRSSLRIFRPSLTDADKLNCQMSRKGLGRPQCLVAAGLVTAKFKLPQHSRHRDTTESGQEVADVSQCSVGYRAARVTAAPFGIIWSFDRLHFKCTAVLKKILFALLFCIELCLCGAHRQTL